MRYGCKYIDLFWISKKMNVLSSERRSKILFGLCRVTQND